MRAVTVGVGMVPGFGVASTGYGVPGFGVASTGYGVPGFGVASTRATGGFWLAAVPVCVRCGSPG